MEVLTPILKYIVSHSTNSSHSSHSNNSSNPFDDLVTKLVEHVDRPVHSIQEMRQHRSTKVKGDVFELFCVVYLRHQGYNVWLLKNIPDDVRVQLGIGTRDVGIDLVAEKNGRYSAVQCKFKRPRPGFVKGTWLPYNCVNWKEVSTFFSLCHRTQETANWQYHMVMTNTKYVRRMGKATIHDKTIAYGTFAQLTGLNMASMIPVKRRVIIESELESELEPKPELKNSGIEDMREVRLRRFQK
jgi:predicted helicase